MKAVGREHGAKKWCEASGGSVRAEDLHRRGREPVEERWLVEEGQAVLRRHDPVARAQHLPRDADIAAFLGQRERMQADGESQPGQHGEAAEETGPAHAERARRRLGHGQALRVVARHSNGRNSAAQTVQSTAADQIVALAK
jgi:hypothetical protein